MSIKIITKYFCDVCGTEVPEKSLISAVVPAESSDGTEYRYPQMELCSLCLERLHQCVEQNFARIVFDGRQTHVQTFVADQNGANQKRHKISR